MIRPGDTMENPFSGETLTFRATSQETDGASIAFTVHLAPQGIGPREHIHPHQEESFRVVSGTLTAGLDGRRGVFRAGEAFVVPAGMRHRWWNETDEAAVIEVVATPALRLEELLENMFAMVKLGYADAKGVPGVLRLSRVLPRFWDVFCATRPPLAVQRIGFFFMAPLARLLGYPPNYSYPREAHRE